MGQGGVIGLVNGTPYDWDLIYIHSYQMEAWQFPAVIGAGAAITEYVEFQEGIGIHSGDDAGEAKYRLRGTDKTFEVQVRGSPHFHLQVWFETLATPDVSAGQTVDLGWIHNGQVEFILSGSVDNFLPIYQPNDWMQSNLNLLGSRTLRELCMPGSHDAGMSLAHHGTAGTNACNTVTQTRNIHDQLVAGARYFDIRPTITGGQLATGHYSYAGEVLGFVGANGQYINEIIDQINNFLNHNNELIILSISKALNTDNDHWFNAAQWEWLFNELMNLQHRYIVPNAHDIDLSRQPLDSFIGGGRSAVLIIVDHNCVAPIRRFIDRGIYSFLNFFVYDQYSNTNDINIMWQDQINKLRAERTTPQARPFLLSWTLTQSQSQAINCAIPLIPHTSILDLARIVNPELYRHLLHHCTPQCFPNILYVDDIGNRNLVGLAMAVNRKVIPW